MNSINRYYVITKIIDSTICTFYAWTDSLYLINQYKQTIQDFEYMQVDTYDMDLDDFMEVVMIDYGLKSLADLSVETMESYYEEFLSHRLCIKTSKNGKQAITTDDEINLLYERQMLAGDVIIEYGLSVRSAQDTLRILYPYIRYEDFPMIMEYIIQKFNRGLYELCATIDTKYVDVLDLLITEGVLQELL